MFLVVFAINPVKPRCVVFFTEDEKSKMSNTDAPKAPVGALAAVVFVRFELESGENPLELTPEPLPCR